MTPSGEEGGSPLPTVTPVEANFSLGRGGGSCSVLKFGELSVFSESNNSKASQFLSDATNRPLVCGAARRARQLDGKRPVDPRGRRGAKFFDG